MSNREIVNNTSVFSKSLVKLEKNIEIRFTGAKVGALNKRTERYVHQVFIHTFKGTSKQY